MAEPRAHDPVLLVVAAFSRHEDALAWGRLELERAYGPIALTSAPFAFTETGYYEPTMGPELLKQFLAFQNPIPPEALATIKLQTNGLEEQLARLRRFPEARPLNLDPGILTLGKFLLATTKDQQHRIYLRDGIFAEVTLRYQAGAYEPWPWTYADYRRPEVHAFLQLARAYYRDRLRNAP
jgi:Domain of unknown function (DUF4416)